MIKIDENMLKDLGLDALPEEERKKLLLHIYETLELRVGMSLARQMSDQQLDEFEQIIDGAGGDDQEMSEDTQKQALTWLEQNFPDYKKVVTEELEKLKTEIKRDSQAIIEATEGEQQAS